MQAIGTVLVFLLAVVVSGFLARVSRLPVPLVQIALGATLHGLGVKTVALEPDLFFLLFLPPLLFLDGWRIPNDALRRDAPTILTLALGLVLVTVLGMGWFIHALIPSMPLAVAFALAAVISPTDPIAVSAIAGNTQIPRRLMHILQGESLLNDASGLVCLRFAVAAAVAGSFSLSAALTSFVWVAGAGLAVGAVVTAIVARTMVWSSARFGDDGGGQILVTLLIPFRLRWPRRCTPRASWPRWRPASR
jgi:CPA1 family monovalent cation:H+ antiporter